MVFKTMPPDFDRQISVTACLIDLDGKFLILRRDTDKPRWPNLWNMPGGHQIGDKSAQDAVIRGVIGDTRIVLDPEQFLESHELYVRYGNEPDFYDVIYTVFVVRLETEPAIRLTPGDHSEFRWLRPREIADLPMIPYENEIIDLILSA